MILLHNNEGIYVRNVRTGNIRVVFGKSYLLNHEEELWEKKLSPKMIQLLKSNHDSDWDGTRVIKLCVPRNSVVQICDYMYKTSRVELGPTIAMLGPYEEFTHLSLSGGKPKRPDMIQSLILHLGPDFISDVVPVETADHAVLSLHLSYNWMFLPSNDNSQSELAKLFSINDFIGFVCKIIGSCIRGTVASTKFDDFHKV